MFYFQSFDVLLLKLERAWFNEHWDDIRTCQTLRTMNNFWVAKSDSGRLASTNELKQ